MTAPYKLHSEIRSLVIAKYKKYPSFGCRKLSRLLIQEDSLEVSKTSIHNILVEAGLRSPVGRRPKRRKQQPVGMPAPVRFTLPEPQKPPEDKVGVEVAEFTGWGSPTSCSGAIFLKAVDYLLGGIALLADTLREDARKAYPDLEIKLQALLYHSFLQDNPLRHEIISALLARRMSPDVFLRIQDELQNLPIKGISLAKITPRLFQESLCCRMTLSDARTFCIDGQLHTSWSTLHIPFDFSGPFVHLRRRLEAFLHNDAPLCLFMAPGYDVPTKELFFLLDGVNAREASITKCTIYGNRSDELEVIECPDSRRRSCVLAVWPWQFNAYRQVEKMGEFSPFTDALTGKAFYKAELELSLTQPELKRSLVLKGCALKNSPHEKVRVMIVSGNFDESRQGQDIASFYLSHWPHLEEAFQDFSRKVELFTYTATAHRLFSPERDTESGASSDMAGFCRWYVKNMDKFLRWHFFPSGFESLDLDKMRELLYEPDVQIHLQGSVAKVTLMKDPAVAYACRRLNELRIRFQEKDCSLFFVA